MIEELQYVLRALEEVVHEGEQLGAVDDLQRVQVEALEQLEVHRLRHADAALGEEQLSVRRGRGDAAVLLAVLLLAVGPATLIVVLLLVVVELPGGGASHPLDATAIEGIGHGGASSSFC